MQDKRKILYQSDYCKKEDACKEKMFAKRRCLQKKKMMENAYKEYEMKQNIIRRKKNSKKKIALCLLLSFLVSNITAVFAADGKEMSMVLKTQETGLQDDEGKTQELSPEEKVEAARQSLSITSSSAILMDAASGQILYEKNAYDKKYPASITKVMTMLVALEQEVPLTDVITMSDNAIWGFDRSTSHIALDVGEQVTVEQCMYAIVLESANEASLALAEHVGGSVEGFASLMNAKAKELGCKNSNFVNPHGLFDENHYVCAYDMALITQEAMKYDLFRTISATSNYTIPPTNKQPLERPLWNSNKMIRASHELHYSYAEGGKTGYITESKNTYVAYAKKGDIELICVVLEAEGATTAYTETKNLFEFGFENYDFIEVAKEFSFISSNYKDTKDVIGNLTQKQLSELVIDRNAVALAPKGLDASYFTYEVVAKEDVSTEELSEEDLYAKEYDVAGVYIGNLKVFYEEQFLFELPIWTSVKEESTVRPEDFIPKKKIMIQTTVRVLLLLVLAGSCAVTISVYEKRRREKNR